MEDNKIVHSRNKTLGNAFIFGFVIWLLYIVLVFSSETTGLNAIVMYCWSPLALLIGVLFFYLYLFFKAKKQLLFFGITTGLSLFAIAYSNSIGNIDLVVDNLWPRKTLPVEFKTYQDFSKKKLSFGEHEMRLRFTSSTEIQQYLLDSKEMIIKTTAGPEDSLKTQFYKLDIYSNVIDEYRGIESFYEGKEEIIDGFLVNRRLAYYTTWAFDGDKERKKMHRENVELEQDPQTVSQRIKDIYSQADVIRFNYDFDYPYSVIPSESSVKSTVYVITYQINKQWYQYFSLQNVENMQDLDGLKSQAKVSLLTIYNKNTRDWIVPENKNIVYRFFQKEQKVREVKPIGGGDPANVYKLWKGKLYSTITVSNDTLKVYQNVYVDTDSSYPKLKIKGQDVGALYDENREFTQGLMLYENPLLNYALLSDDLLKLYIVKSKRN